MTGLAIDPKRQAKDALRGYIFQILRSVLVWLELDDQEELYLEGAEDLDRIAAQDVVVEQVKDTTGSGNITLRTVSVLDAINNFWLHRNRNPGHAVRFRYLTTSGIGVEQGSPFGPDQSGLALWTAARAASHEAALQAAAAIASFLKIEVRTSVAVKTFLAAASSAEIIDALIRPIEWITGQQDGSTLERQIKDRLVIHGAAAGVAPADAEQAFYPLYAAAFDAAKTKDGVPLTRAEFLRIFAGATAIQLPKQELATMMRAAFASSGTGMAIQVSQSALEGRPPLAPRFFSRAAAEAQVRDALARGAALLHGATGTGKTMLAVSALNGTASAWLSLRDLGPAEVKARLMAAREALRSEGRACTLILDDLDGLADPRHVEGPLSALWSVQRELGGQMLLTSDRPLPARLAQAIDLQVANELQMAPFDDVEIRAFLTQEGCPEDRRSAWTNVLEMTSLGHPQLLYARIAALRQAHFPRPTPADLLKTPPDVDRVRTEARRLIAELPDGPRELLYRASLVTSRMTRNRLMAIARLETALKEPGAAIDTVVGPWLEMTDAGDYRVSPLARGAAEEARGNAWAKSMHRKLGWIFLLERSITPWDIAAIMSHSLLSGSAAPLAHMMPALFGKSDETWEHIAEACEMFTALALEPGTELPFNRAIDNFIYRAFQYRIAVVASPETAMRIAAQFDAESAAITLDDGTRFFRFLFLSQVLQRVTVHYPIASVVRHGLEFMRLANVLTTTLPDRLAHAGMTLDENEEVPDYQQFVALPLLHHVLDFEQFDVFLGVLATLPRDDARRLLKLFAGPEDQAAMIVERIWLAEYRSKLCRWQAVRQTFTIALKVAIDLDAETMARAIAPLLVRLIDEELEDAGGALEEAKRLTTLIGDDPLLRCATAMVLNRRGDRAEALSIWADELPRWPNPVGNLTCAFAGRNAAIAAARMGRWAEAASFFEDMAGLMVDGPNKSFWVGLRMDAGFSHFMANDHSKAIEIFDEVVTTLAPLQAELDHEPLLSLQRRAGGVLAAIMRWHTEGRPTDVANLAGMCSNPDPLVTDASLAPPLDMLAVDLFRIDLAYGESVGIALRYADTLRSTPILSLRILSARYLFGLAQRTRHFDDIVADGLAEGDALTEAADQRERGVIEPLAHLIGVARPWDSGTAALLLSTMMATVFDLAAANELDGLPLERWRSDARAHREGVPILALVDYLDALFVTGTLDPWDQVLNLQSGLWTEHLMAALAATLLQPLTSEPLMICHGFWAHYLAIPTLSPVTGAAVATLVSRQWAAMCRMPALLVAPRTSVPAILAAIASPATGWTKTRAILVAAMEAAPRASDDMSRAAIEAIVV